jgi:hypothetical protein
LIGSVNVATAYHDDVDEVMEKCKYTKVVPMTSQKEAAESLIDFTDDVGIPETLVTDGATEFTGKHTLLNRQDECG